MRVRFMIGLVIGVLSIHVALASDPIPPKTVVLTFDDAVKSHRTFVGPLLQELGFGATFFVTHLWMDDEENFMSWEEIAELHEMGFEIGNHTWTHLALNEPVGAGRLAGELALVEYELDRAGVPKPKSFAWPGNAFGPESLAVLRERGYRFARRGMQPEIPYGEIQIGAAYNPEQHDPLLIPSTGDAYPDWTMEYFKKAISNAEPGRAVILQFHGVPDEAHPWVHTHPDRFEAWMRHLKGENYNVIALRDLGRYLPERPVNDPIAERRHPDVPDYNLEYPQEYTATHERPNMWWADMHDHYRYSHEEIETVSGLTPEEQVTMSVRSSRIIFDDMRVVPYPGGRHPRIGFLDGAVNPQRGTKAGIFAPWKDGGYAVVDLPEAIFSNLGLIFLAHTHIPTLWDEQDIVVENVDWERHAPDRSFPFGGVLTMQRTLPNGIEFGSTVKPREDGADLSMWLWNKTDEELTGLRTQVCLMLKGLTGFAEQTNDNKVFDDSFAAARNEAGDRWVTIEFENTGRTWGNADCPCIHADPVFPDAAPGKIVKAAGRVRFHDAIAIERIQSFAEAFKGEAATP